MKRIRIKDPKTNKIFQSVEEAKIELNVGKTTIFNMLRDGRLIYDDEDIEGEIWRDHPRFDIKCSNKGRVQRNYCKTFGAERYGYMLFGFGKPYKQYRVHRLIAECWFGFNELSIDHIDKNKKNNCVENLEFVTLVENNRRRSNK